MAEEEEEGDEAEFQTPPSTPVKIKPLPRSLARSTSKKLTRQVQNLRTRVEELRGCQLSKDASFLVNTWNYEFGDGEKRLSKHVDPDENVAILLNRVQLVYGLFKEAFATVSGVYVGKSINSRVRMQSHMRVKGKEGFLLAMVTVAVFTAEDVPEQDAKRWKMNAETLGLHYERLLADAVRGVLPTYEDGEETGGGGRIANADNVKETCLYMLLSASNDEL
jgi:hypothetical protein